VNLANAGTGTQSHLAGVLLAHIAGLDVAHVPYKGGGPSVTSVVAGESHATLTPGPAVMGHARAGRLRALASGGAKRSPLTPDLPTLIESGIALESTGWIGILAPKKTPSAITGKVHATLKTVLADPATQKLMEHQGADPQADGPAAFTRLLEEELVASANGISGGDTGALAAAAAANDLFVPNRVLNLETGSLAVEAALKMVLTRFYRIEAGGPAPKYAGRTPVILVMGNDDGGFQANYHGTTIVAQTLRGMWPEFYAAGERAKLYRICPLRPNNFADLEAAFAKWEGDGHKIAGFFHEIVMMNYGGKLLSPEFLKRAYGLCRAHDVPTVVDEIQSCMWHHDFFMFREWGLTPSCVGVGKGFPGGEYPASRLIFSSVLDVMPQFGALVTNGQEELASLAYLVTMRWAKANAAVTRAIGDYYERRLRGFAAAHPAIISAVEGKRHMATLCFTALDAAKAFARELNRRGLDISAQTYKADCPPSVLTKIPLIATPQVVDFVLEKMEAAIGAEPLSATPACTAKHP